MLEKYDEANYHFTLSAMMDLIRQYGYSNVINDLDAMIADDINRQLEPVHEFNQVYAHCCGLSDCNAGFNAIWGIC